MTTPPSTVENPAMLCEPPRTATSRPWLRANPTALITSAVPAQRMIIAGMLVVDSVPDRPCLVVVVVPGPDDLASQRVLKLTHGGFPNHRCWGCRRGHGVLLVVVIRRCRSGRVMPKGETDATSPPFASS